MNIRRLMLDIDKAVERPSVLELAEALEAVSGVEGVNITVADIDVATVGMEVTIEGENIEFAALENAVEHVGAALHSIDEIVVGTRMVEHVPRAR